MSRLFNYLHKNIEHFFILLILVSVLFVHLFVEFKISILNFYYIPIMVAGYLLGKRLAILYAFFTVLMVWVFILANKGAYLALESQYELNVDLTMWGGFLILAGWAGSLSENLREELWRVKLLQAELARDKDDLKALNDRLNEANRKLEDKVTKRTEELEQSYEKLKVASQTDPLTNLLNRRTCEEKFKYEINRYQRTKVPFSIILCDIDHFKNINDNYGHNTGDHVLVEVANILRENSRKTDINFRWGGEEFLILLPDTELEGGIIVGEKIREKIEAFEFECDGEELCATISLGVAEYEEEQLMEDCLKVADDRLYEAKNAGRNRLYPIITNASS
jgi:diguanylate cyclase (GGDEF)-like protein